MRLMRSKPRFIAYDTLVTRIVAATSPAELEGLRQTIEAYFLGTQREQLEAAVARRETELTEGGESA
jgi:hypothetical protein